LTTSTDVDSSLDGVASCLDSGPRLVFLGDTLLHKRAQRSAVTWLALFALGLILFVPTISRTVAFASIAGTAMGMDCAMHGAMHHGGQPPDAPQALDACGYCTLMCHSPVLTTGLTLTVPSLPAAPLAIRDRRRDAPLPVLLEQRSRGPPVVV